MSEANPYTPPQAELAAGSGRSDQHSPAMVEYLRETGPWVRGLAVLGFVGVGFMALGAVVVMVMAAVTDEDAGSVLGVGVAYLLMGALYLVPAWNLNRYADAISAVSAGGGTTAIETALLRQRTFWRSLGMIFVAGFVVSVLAVVAAFVVGVMAA